MLDDLSVSQENCKQFFHGHMVLSLSLYLLISLFYHYNFPVYLLSFFLLWGLIGWVLVLIGEFCVCFLVCVQVVGCAPMGFNRMAGGGETQVLDDGAPPLLGEFSDGCSLDLFLHERLVQIC